MPAEPLHHRTPLFCSTPLSRQFGQEVWIKVEAMQPVGSFKLRGIGSLCCHYAEQGKTHFISSSGGNAALAAAYAGKKLGIPVTVVVPTTTSPLAQKLIRAEGAKLIAQGDEWSESDVLAREMAKEENSAYIPPFDHPLIWSGNSTMIDEVVEAGFKPDAVVLSVGGGGMLCGIAEGLHRAGWKHLPIYAVEPPGAASFNAAVSADRVVRLDHVRTVAKTLGSPYVTEGALDWYRRHPIKSRIVTDSNSVNACFRFLEDHRLLVEPSCGATLSLVYEQDSELQKEGKILLIVCGGAGVSMPLLEQWRLEASTVCASENPPPHLQ